MKLKPAMGAVAAAPLILLLLLVGGLRGAVYLQGTTRAEAADETLIMPRQNGQTPTPAPPLKAADKATIAALRKVVGGQIGALQKSDFTKALLFSAPQFRNQWKPADFGQMIASGYPELMNSKIVSFGEAKVSPDGTVAFMTVAVQNAQKRETRFAYILTRDAAPAKSEKSKSNNQAGSSWHVSGCERQSPSLVPAAPHSLNEA